MKTYTKTRNFWNQEIFYSMKNPGKKKKEKKHMDKHCLVGNNVADYPDLHIATQ